MMLQCCIGSGVTRAPSYTNSSTAMKLFVAKVASFASYRNASEVIEFAKISKISSTTLHDRVENMVTSIEDERVGQRTDILVKNGFSHETGYPISKQVLEDCKKRAANLIDVPDFADISKLVDELNAAKDPSKDLLIPCVNFRERFETCYSKHIYVMADEVGVKQQTFDRDIKILSQGNRATRRRAEHHEMVTDFTTKNRCAWSKGVYTAVAYILWDNSKFILAAPSMNELMVDLTAFMLKNDFLFTRKMVFFSDGAHNIRTAIDNHFDYVPHQFILDWFHITQFLKQYVSMAYKGTAEEKRKIRYAIEKQLWVFDWVGALKTTDYLKEQGFVKNESRHEGIRRYLNAKSEYMTCYALRKEHHLPNSSSQAEKANDILVASRQKHRGASWSKFGSNTMAKLTQYLITLKLEKSIKALKEVDFFIVECANDTTEVADARAIA